MSHSYGVELACQFLAKTDGRDKLGKALQNYCRAAAYYSSGEKKKSFGGMKVLIVLITSCTHSLSAPTSLNPFLVSYRILSRSTGLSSSSARSFRCIATLSCWSARRAV